MRIVEIRDLDGPNLFMQSPAIKVEIGDTPEARTDELIDVLAGHVRQLHREVGLEEPEIASRDMEEPGDFAVAFSWRRRAFAMALGKRAAQLTTGERDDLSEIVTELKEVLASDPDDDDAPLLVRAAGRSIPIIAVTGTNGKTTTTRLISFVLKFSGKTVGYTSSAGVFINKERVLEGDYSGPSGARRVFEHPQVDIAVLETARGGMLLRGCGYEEADVAVVTNVTEDHLGLHGVYSIEGLAKVKSIVARNVKPGGFCVLNADDLRVLQMAEITPGTPVLFSRDPQNKAVADHIAQGGSAVHLDAEGQVVWQSADSSTVITRLVDIPMTFGGKAPHQVENALGAIGALIGIGVPFDVIRDGLREFRSSAEESKGRLNVFKVNDATVIIDFAHNEVGLQHLLNFGREMVEGDGKLYAIVGTAGDREDKALRKIARRAADMADVVVLKDSAHYLRGRESGEMIRIMREGVAEAESSDAEVLEAPDERTATLRMLDRIAPGDVLAVMCIEDYEYLIAEISQRGTPQL